MQTIFLSHLNPWRLLASLVILIATLLQPAWSQVSRAIAASEMARPNSALVPAVVYVAGDGHVHEIVLKGIWQDRELTAAAGAPIPYTGFPQQLWRIGEVT